MQPLLPDFEQLSLAQQVAQMVVVRAAGYLFDHQIRYPVWEPTAATLRQWVAELGVGGVILLGGSAAEVALQTTQLQQWATVPLLLAADVEEGVGQRFAGATWGPPPLALGAIAQTDPDQAAHWATALGALTAREAQAIGLNWVLAPVVDVNNNPANPVINVRALGETPALVSQLAQAFLRGVQQYPVLSAAKHFPGHGDTAVDSHLELPVLPHDRARLEQIEFPPFQAAIAAGVDAVMSAHVRLPALDAADPATLSRPILTELLREQWGFAGLIVTDALVMGAIARHYGPNEAAVRAVEAGADILLMPADPVGAVQAVCDAVASGRLSADRIAASVARIWQAKQKVCGPPPGTSAHAWETPPPHPADTLPLTLAPAAARSTVADILQAAQIHHGALLPAVSAGRNLIVVDSWLNCDFLDRAAPAIALPQTHGYAPQLLDSQHSPPGLAQCLAPQPTLLQLFIRGNPFRGSADLSTVAWQVFQTLLATEQLQALVLYGSPYLLEKFTQAMPPDVPYVFTYGQMPQAQAIALQALGCGTSKTMQTRDFC